MSTSGTLIGYARVSTAGQDLTVQVVALKNAGCDRIFQDVASGAKSERPELARMFDHLRAGDVVIVVRLDRLARSTRDLLEIADRLAQIGAGLRSLGEPWADTTTPAGRMVLTVFAGIADFERALISERTKAALAVGRARGRKGGRRVAVTPDIFKRAQALINDKGLTVREAAAALDVGRSTLYRALGAKETER